MKTHSTDWFKYCLLKDLLYLTPYNGKKILYGIGDPAGSKRLDSGESIIRSTTDVIRDFARQGLLTLDDIGDNFRLDLRLYNDIQFEIKIENIQMLRSEFKKLQIKYNLNLTNKIILDSKPSDWIWLDRNLAKYQFGSRGVIKVSGKSAKKIFQESMDLFHNFGFISLGKVSEKTQVEKGKIRRYFNYFNQRNDLKEKGLSFKGSGKGYYNIESTEFFKS